MGYTTIRVSKKNRLKLRKVEAKLTGNITGDEDKRVQADDALAYLLEREEKDGKDKADK